MGVDGDDIDPIEAAITRFLLGVPRNMRAYRQWLMWRYEDAEGAGQKARKVPYYANGRRRRGVQGAIEDRARMVDFDGAIDAYRLGKGFYSGIGIAHFADSPLCTIDFDNCVTDSKVDPGVRALIDASGSYAELSPGGKGVHLVLLGDIASRKNIHPDGYNVEAFGDSGFVTITGRAIASDVVTECPADVRATLLRWLSNENNAHERERGSQIEYTRGTDAAYIKLKMLGMVKRDWPDGRVAIRCPFEAAHTSGAGLSDTVYFLPRTHGYAEGHFHCLHAHCAERSDADFLAAIGFVSGIPGIDASSRNGDQLFYDAGAFMDAWRPFEYIVKGLLQRGHLHSLTGHSNAGKTAIALLLAVCVAYGMPFGGRKTNGGNVAYFAGENPDDVRVRVIALCQALRLDPARLASTLWIAPHTFAIARNAAKVAEKLKELGDLSLLVIDTRAAYGSADDENDNVQALYDAQAVRGLMEKAGRPAVLVLNHPPQGAPIEGLRPRGGSSYINEFDCNLTAWNDAGNITLHANKIRGPLFDPISLTLRQHTLLGYAQPDGDAIVSIIAEVTGDDRAEGIDAQMRAEENALMRVMRANPNGSERAWADGIGVPRIRIQRLLKQLADDKLVRRYRRRWILTKRGHDELPGSGPAPTDDD